MSNAKNKKQTARAQKRAEKERKRKQKRATRPTNSNQRSTRPGDAKRSSQAPNNMKRPLMVVDLTQPTPTEMLLSREAPAPSEVTAFGGFIYGSPAQNFLMSMYWDDFAPNPESSNSQYLPVVLAGDDDRELFERMKVEAPECPPDKKHFILFDIRSDMEPVKRLYELGEMVMRGMTPLDQNVLQIDMDGLPITHMIFFYHDGTLDSVFKQLALATDIISTGKESITSVALPGQMAFSFSVLKNDLKHHFPDEVWGEPSDGEIEKVRKDLDIS